MKTPYTGEDAEKLNHSHVAVCDFLHFYECKNGTAPLENSSAFSLKTKYALTVQLNNSTAGHLSQRNDNVCLHKNTYINVYRSLFLIVKIW